MLSSRNNSCANTTKSEDTSPSKNSLDSFRNNMYSLPKRSHTSPLRSVLLDPAVNNIPPSKTRSEYIRKIKKLNVPSKTYDVDGDGEVSHDDYRISKKVDIKGKGKLTDDEMKKAKTVAIDEFIQNHGEEVIQYYGHSSNQGDSIPSNRIQIQEVNATFDKMRQLKSSVRAAGSRPMRDCLHLEDNSLIKHNFYTNKYDQTAWNDYDAIPRSSSLYGLTDHGGSRRRLIFARREKEKEHAAALMEWTEQKQPRVDTRRLKLISDISVENS